MKSRWYFLLFGVLFAVFTHTTHAATFTVDSTAETSDASAGDGVCDIGDGSCTLRAAVEEANALAGADTIEFDISGAGPHTITHSTTLNITEQVTIDGTTETGSSCGDLWSGTAPDLQIELISNDSGFDAGFNISSTDSDGTEIRGLVINNFTLEGIYAEDADNLVFECNIIGLKPDGITRDANARPGIYLNTGADNARIGGTAAGEGNVIAGNGGEGDIRLWADGTQIYGNFIGVSATGTTQITGPDGINIRNTASTTVGTTTASGRNLIGNPSQSAIYSSDPSVHEDITIVGNYFGVKPDGTGFGTEMDHIVDLVLDDGGSGTLRDLDIVITDNFFGDANTALEITGDGVAGVTVRDNNIGIGPDDSTQVAYYDFDAVYIDGEQNFGDANFIFEDNIVTFSNLAGMYVTDVNDISFYGNYFGTNANGDDFGSRLNGLLIGVDVSNLTIGSTTTGQSNVFAFNDENGVEVQGTADNNIQVVGNIMHSNTQNGIEFDLDNSKIGTIVSDNTIYNNTLDGILYTGTGDGLAIRQNNIYLNGDKGIEGSNSTTAGADNDGLGDVDTGANTRQNSPTSLSGSIVNQNVTVSGELRSTASRTFTVDVFAGTTTDASGYGEGQDYIGTFQVTTDGTGLATFTDEGPFEATTTGSAPYITMTATDDTTNSTSEFSQSVQIAEPLTEGPGGVTDAVTLWLRADAGISTSTGVALWEDQSAYGNNASNTTAGEQPDYTLHAINFNPVVTFDGVDEYLSGTAGFYDDSYWVVIQNDGITNAASSPEQPFGADTDIAGIGLGAVTGSLTDEIITHAASSPSYRRGYTDGSASVSAEPHIIHVALDGAGTNNDVYLDGVQINNSSAGTYNALDNERYRLGKTHNASFPYRYSGDVAEAISFSSRHSSVSKNKVESYLALKYGITLDNSLDYIDSASTTIWDTSANVGYTNDIAGIGVDASSTLSQLQSRSESSDSILTVGGASALGNREFLMWGNNDGDVTATSSLINGAGEFERFNRAWKLQETGDVGTVDVTIDVTGTAFAGSDLSLLRLIHSTSSSFNTSSESPATTTASTATFEDVDFGSSEYMTFGTDETPVAKGVSVVLAAGSVTEGGATTTLNVALTGEPSTTVAFTLTTTSQATTSTSTLTFTTGNYSATQTVTITAIDDDIDDGDQLATTTLTASSSDLDYNGTTTAVTYTVVDNDTAGVSVIPTSLTLTEGALDDVFNLTLDSEPTANVTVLITTTNQATTSTSTLQFTSGNWDTGYNVTVSAIDDLVVEGTHYATTTVTFTSADSNYNNTGTSTVVSTITDDDSPGAISVVPTAIFLTEGAVVDTFNISLDTEPGSNVDVIFTTTDQATTSTSTITFTPGNYSTGQTIQVTAINDAVAEGTHYATTSITASSSDPNYNGLIATSVVATITDDDTAGFLISDTTMEVTEGGSTDSFTVALTTMPTGTVTITITTDTAEATTSTSTLTFTTGNYNTPQTVTVSAIDDADIEGGHSDILTLTGGSSDGNYNNATSSVTVTITDNDSVPGEETEEVDNERQESRPRGGRLFSFSSPTEFESHNSTNEETMTRAELIAELERQIEAIIMQIIALLLSQE